MDKRFLIDHRFTSDRKSQFVLVEATGSGRHCRKRDIGKLTFRWEISKDGINRPDDQFVRLNGRAFKIGFVHDGMPFWAQEVDA